MNKDLIWGKIKSTLGIRSYRQFIALYKRKIEKKIYKKKYGCSEILGVLNFLGIKSGDTLVIHSSWDEFYNFKETPTQLINCIIEYLGENGNLIMPSFPLNDIYKYKKFNLKRDPTGAGILAETFRRFPGVNRSVELHSVAVFGPLANTLNKDILNLHSAWGPESVYRRLIDSKSKIICFGLEKHYLPTQYHCVEDQLKSSSQYYAQFFTEKIKVEFILEDGNKLENFYFVSDQKFVRKVSRFKILYMLKWMFDRDKYKTVYLSNLRISYFDSSYLYQRLISLHYLGFSVYKSPKYNKCEKK